jgi:hypothetical protein
MKSPRDPHYIMWVLTPELVQGIEQTMVMVPAWDRSMPNTPEYWRKRGHHC